MLTKTNASLLEKILFLSYYLNIYLASFMPEE